MDLHSAVRQSALPLQTEADLDPLLERIGDARYVLIGEASHGTHEYYQWRAALTRRLIAEKGFSFVGVEGDWPDCYAVNCSTSSAPDAPEDPAQVLAGFDRWPTWMWANRNVADFTRWLREFNRNKENDEPVGFYGLDVYSLWDSLRATLDYLKQHRPDQVEAALEAFHCFEPYAEDPQRYARATALIPTDCQSEVINLLTGMLSEANHGSGQDRDSRFNAEQNALVAAGAEEYYRAMVSGGPESWNVRDQHMFDTLGRLMGHYGPAAKSVVWGHNTHVGDARYTDMADAGMFNIGQLVRQEHEDDGVVLIGFGGYQGTVVAGDHWGGRTQTMNLPPAVGGSTEAAMHEALVDQPAALFIFDSEQEWARKLRDHRAVGVVYHPENERRGNYVPTVLNGRYDAFLWFNDTTGLKPLPGAQARGVEMETWPQGQ